MDCLCDPHVQRRWKGVAASHTYKKMQTNQPPLCTLSTAQQQLLHKARDCAAAKDATVRPRETTAAACVLLHEQQQQLLLLLQFVRHRISAKTSADTTGAATWSCLTSRRDD